MPAALLRTKLYRPLPRPGLVTRPRLVQKLDRSLRESIKLVLVSAPPGYGKTTLLAEWLEHQETPSAWLSLDPQDDTPARFWTYVIGALQPFQPGLGQAALEALQSPQPPTLELVLQPLLNEIGTRSEPLILVLDDYHSVPDPAVHATVRFVLEHLPPLFHLVICTRTDPPLPLSRLRANNQLAEIRAADLRFTSHETADFMRRCMSLDLSDENLYLLEERSEGWITGLQLAALSLQGRDAASAAELIAGFSGRQQFILDYLTDEVLSRQPEPVQEFLLQTSILDRLTAPLCDAVTGRSDAQATLERLGKANLFLVPLDGEQCWYRYHHLFTDLLRARLQQSSPSGVNALHARASAWYERHGLMNDAVQHSLAARDVERVAALIKQAAPRMFLQSELTTVLGWLRNLPEDFVRRDPRLSMIYAWGLLATNRVEEVEPHLKDVERAVGSPADASPHGVALSESIRGALGEVLVIRSNLASHARHPERTLELAEQSLAYLGDGDGLFHSGDRLRAISLFNRALGYELLGDVEAAGAAFETVLTTEPRDPHLTQLASSHLAQLRVVQGALGEAAEISRHALDIGGRGTDAPNPLSGIAHASLGSVLVEWNRFAEARLELEAGLRLGRQWNNLETLVLCHLSLARMAAASDDLEGGIGLLDEYLGLADDLQVHWADSVVDGYRVYLQARQGNPDAARRYLHESKLALESDIPFAREAEGIGLARVRLVLGEPWPALELLDRLQVGAERGKRSGRLVTITTLRALALHALGRPSDSLGAIANALSLAEPQGCVRVFLDEGEAMVVLLEKTLARGLSRAYVRRLLAQFDRRAGEPPPQKLENLRSLQPLAEPLTEREMQVLKLLAQGLSNRDIAGKLYLSPNTLRVHVYNVNSKLGTHSRLQAVLRARELGLLK